MFNVIINVIIQKGIPKSTRHFAPLLGRITTRSTSDSLLALHVSDVCPVACSIMPRYLRENALQRKEQL